MARVTVEDCVVRVPNRFELVMLAAQRGRNLGAGAPPSVDRDNDKNPVIALREIAEETVDYKDLETQLVRSLQKHVEVDEPADEEMDLLILDQTLSDEGIEAAPAEEIREDVLHIEDENGNEVDDEDSYNPPSMSGDWFGEPNEDPDSKRKGDDNP